MSSLPEKGSLIRNTSLLFVPLALLISVLATPLDATLHRGQTNIAIRLLNVHGLCLTSTNGPGRPSVVFDQCIDGAVGQQWEFVGPVGSRRYGGWTYKLCVVSPRGPRACIADVGNGGIGLEVPRPFTVPSGDAELFFFHGMIKFEHTRACLDAGAHGGRWPVAARCSPLNALQDFRIEVVE